MDEPKDIMSHCSQIKEQLNNRINNQPHFKTKPAELLKEFRNYFSKNFVFRIVFDHKLRSLLEELNLRDYVIIPFWYEYETARWDKEWKTLIVGCDTKYRSASILIGEK